MEKNYTVIIGSMTPVYFKSAYAGMTSAKFRGTVVIYTENEGFGDAGNATDETMRMVSLDFCSGLTAVLTARYEKDANTNPSEYVPDKNELITAVNEYAVKHGYSVISIDRIDVEIDSAKRAAY